MVPSRRLTSQQHGEQRTAKAIASILPTSFLWSEGSDKSEVALLQQLVWLQSCCVVHANTVDPGVACPPACLLLLLLLLQLPSCM
jgi:hypothetical protein